VYSKIRQIGETGFTSLYTKIVAFKWAILKFKKKTVGEP
jgi:hypothetical protein